jgi:hypothetical protein
MRRVSVVHKYSCVLFVFVFVFVLCCCVHVACVRVRGLSSVGSPIACVTGGGLSHTIKVSLLTCVVPGVSPVFVCFRDGVGRANSQFDFLLFVIECLLGGWLVQGDVLVLDNASIHKAQHILLPLSFLLRAAGVRMWMLPTYSPAELNPCVCAMQEMATLS